MMIIQKLLGKQRKVGGNSKLFSLDFLQMYLLQAFRQSIKISEEVVWLLHLTCYVQNFICERSFSNSCHNSRSLNLLFILTKYIILALYEVCTFNPYPTAFPYGNGMVLHFYQQQESSTTKTVHKVINKGFKTYV